MTDFLDGPVADVHQHELEAYSDNRGHLVELFREDVDEVLPEMCYASVTLKGVTRGPHEHRNQTDVFVFMRAVFNLWLWDARRRSGTYGNRQRILTSSSCYTQIIVPPGVVHAYQAVDQDGLVLNFPDKLYKGWNKLEPVDEIRHEDDPTSVFKPWK